MSRKIIWSGDAKRDFSENIDYLLKEWSVNEAVDFTDKAQSILDKLPKNPELFPETEYSGVRKCVVCKQISLFYRVTKKEITLLRFWNNWKDPDSLEL